mgnify:CR=1 FL=1
MIPAETFWREKTLEQPAAEQNMSPVRRFEDLWGKGSDLWTHEAHFELFPAAGKGGQDTEGREGFYLHGIEKS